MDGAKAKLRHSLKLKLSIGIATAISIVALVAVGLSFFMAFEEANELQDGVLRQVAALGDHQHLTSTEPMPASAKGSEEEEIHLIIQYLGTAASHDERSSKSGLPLPADIGDGMHTLDIAGDPYRVIVRTTNLGERIAVSQGLEIRDEIAIESAFRSVLSLLILLPLLLLVVTLLIRSALRPVDLLAADVDRRSDRDLSPVRHEHVPTELVAFVNAINRLLGRVARAVDTQRRFVADAAHELRSPLTALALQAERLAATDMPPPARERLESLARGIERGRALLDQLLALARAQSAKPAATVVISIHAMYRKVLEELFPIAEARRVDIGVIDGGDVFLQVEEVSLRTMVRNLIDNAIRYTGPGGRVDISVTASGDVVTLEVRDTGPGIPLSEMSRVFDPFYRILGSEELGSGLGLSIVQANAQRIGASVELTYADPAAQIGLSAKVRIPRQPPPETQFA